MLDTIILLGGAFMVAVPFIIMGFVSLWREKHCEKEV